MDKEDFDYTTVGESSLLSSSEPASASLLGCIALVAGTTVEAGALALPAKSLSAGFTSTAILLIFGWLYMVTTGLLIAEVTINTLCNFR